MTIEQLIYFSEVYRQKSINAASFNLNISQQCLSRSIAALEKEFATIFFVRSKKGSTATPDGIEFYKFAQDTISKYFRLKTNFKGVSYPSKIKIGLFYTSSLSFSTDLFNSLSKTFPNIFFDVTFLPYDWYRCAGADSFDLTCVLLPEFIDQVFPLSKIYIRANVSPAPLQNYCWCNKNSPLAKYTTIAPQLLNGATILCLKNMSNKNNYLPFFASQKVYIADYYEAETKDIFCSLMNKLPYVAT